MYEEWFAGVKKSVLERRYLNKPESHGKLFTSLVYRHLGIDTEQRSSLSQRLRHSEEENRRLRALLHSHGINPDPKGARR